MSSNGYLSVFDRLSKTETRSSAMKKPIFFKNKGELNTSGLSISSASVRSHNSKGTTRTSASRMSTRTALVRSSLFDRLAKSETYASASMKGKIEVESAPRSQKKTTNSFFDRMASHDTYASKSMKGKMQMEEPSNSSVKGKEGKKSTISKLSRRTSKAFFDRLTVCDTYASASMKGKIEPSHNDDSHTPKKTRKSITTSQGFFDRLSKMETCSTRQMKKHGKDENGQTKPMKRSSSSMSVSSKSSRGSFLSRKSVPASPSKSSSILSRKSLFRRKKSTTTSSTVETTSTSSKSSLKSSRKSIRPKVTVSISRPKLSNGSVKSSSSRNTTKSSRSIVSNRSASSRASVARASVKSDNSRSSSNSRPSLAASSQSKRSTASPRKEVKKAVATPRKPVTPLKFESDDELSFGSEDDEEDDDLGSTRPSPKENDNKKENGFASESNTLPVAPPSKSIEPSKDSTTAGGEDPAVSTNEQQQLTEDLALPIQSASEPSSQERASPQDKLPTITSEGTDEKINESMLSFDESYDQEDDEELDDLLGKPENDEAESFQSDDPEDLLDAKEDTSHLQEEQKIAEVDTDTSNKITKFKIFCSDKYHPEKGMQELDAASLNLVDALISYESNKFTNEIISVKIIEALFERDFNDDDHWEVDPASARELDEDEGDGRDLDGRAFQVRQQARLDSDEHYKVAAAKGMITIWPEEDEIRMENYSYYSG